MAIITNSIDIACSPKLVRQKFLAFSTLPTYHSSFFTSITPQGPLEPNQHITVVFAQMGKMDAIVNQNTPTTFTWTGGVPLLFSGAHSFKFEPSTMIQGGTNFTQEEVFSGGLGFVMGDGLVARKMGMREKTMKGWGQFNADLKKWCESHDEAGKAMV